MIRSSRKIIGVAEGIRLRSCSGAAKSKHKKKFASPIPSSADMGDVPSLLAWEQLKKQGIEVVPTFSREPISPSKRWSPAKPTSAPPPASPSSRRWKAA